MILRRCGQTIPPRCAVAAMARRRIIAAIARGDDALT
jgi:hypothetical protein